MSANRMNFARERGEWLSDDREQAILAAVCVLFGPDICITGIGLEPGVLNRRSRADRR